MWNVGLDTGVAITMDSEETPFTEKSYFEILSDSHYIRLCLYLTPCDFLFPILNNNKLFITYTDPIWSTYAPQILEGRIKPIDGVRYYLPCEMQKAIFDILQLDREHLFSEMKLTSLSIEALISAFQSLEKNQNSCNSCSVIDATGLNRDYLEQAFSIIQQRYNEKLTIPEIAKEIGTNQCYLKKGFKLQYSETIFSLITRLRMIRAEDLIKKELSMKLADIAEMVGYSSLSSFSTAFKHYYGYSPQDLKK
jgi:AraC-like DNA-binding protein